MRLLLAVTFAFGVVWSAGGKVLESEAESGTETSEGAELDARAARRRGGERRWTASGPPASRTLTWVSATLRVTAPDVTPPRPRWARPRARPRGEIDDHGAVG
ncbi:MAG: hypothetical protein JNK45_32175 [Myxococcales bacterium]|nr:hypothetical protein [Myxococcales bacterium]